METPVKSIISIGDLFNQRDQGSFSTIENYADLKYEINSKEELESTLKTIADDIKKSDFAGYSDAAEC